MGKKKGKGKGQPQPGGGGGDQPAPGPSTQPETEPEPQVPKTQGQHKGKKERKGPQEPSISPQEPATTPQEPVTAPQEPPQAQPEQQKGRRQRQKKGPQEPSTGPQEPATSPQEPVPTPQEPPQAQPEQQKGRRQKQKKGPQESFGQGPPPQQVQQQQRGPQGPQQQQPPPSSPRQQPQPPPQAWRPPHPGQVPQQSLQDFPQQMMQALPQQQLRPGFLPPQEFRQQQGPRGMPPQQRPMAPQQFGAQYQPQQPPRPAWGQPQVQQQRGFPPGAFQQPPATLPPGFTPPQQMLPPQQQQMLQQQQQQQQQQQMLQQQMPPPQQQPPRQAPQQSQQRQGPQQQKPGQQQRQAQQQQRQPQQPQPAPSPRQQQPADPTRSPKEQSPPFGGQGDCLKQLALVNPGTRGRRIPIESNHLALDVGKLKEAIHYDVNIVPDTPKCLLRDVMNLFGQKHYPKRHPAFDGRKNLYSPTPLPFGDTDSISDVIKVDGENNRPKEFKVEIKFARTVDLSPLHDMLRTQTSPQDALQCLDIVLRNAPSNTCITAGRCFFTPPTGQIVQLGDGMEMYYGFYQSAIRGWKPLLNVDVAHKAFPSALELLDVICQLGSNFRYEMSRNELARPLSDQLQRTLEKFIKTLKVKYEITGQSGSKRIYRVNGLGESPSMAKFKLDDGRQTTVEKYFIDVKRCRLRYPHLPTLWVGAKDRDSKILLPVEFCSVVGGQAINRKMNENQTSAMIKKSATSTDVRKKKIMDSLDRAKYNNDPCIKEFGFSVNNQFEQLEARVLPPPGLLYANNSVVNPSRGVWRSDRSRFLVGATIKKWTIASVTRQPCRPERLAEEIFKMAAPTGMQITAKALPPFVHVSGRQGLNDIIEYFRSKQDFDLIFVVVPNSGPQYSFVKQAAELNVGCLTQCIKERTLMKLNPQTVANILLKVNSKMNGTNHTFNGPSRPLIMSRPCMIMGADVTHPSPDARDIPSVAAVTASHDPKAFQYNICWRLQPPKVEIIEDLCNITMEQLKFFYTKTGCKPERIVFFRDGVSEGQFKEVQRAEIRAIQQACMKVQAEGYQPAITFLVVQKRHHTRLFPRNPRDSEDKNMNVPAGTCVDTMITNPTMQDFYLVSHASIQGVAKPTKYCTLWDDNKMTNDDIEELTYHLCHMFTRCNRSVSYPAPTYYAHLAAARAKVYIENDKLNMDELKRHQQKYQIKDCIVKDKPMFFV